MSRFEFMSTDGDVIEREYRVGKAPRVVRVRGTEYRRIPSVPAVPMFAEHVNGRNASFLGRSIDPAHHKFHRGQFHKDANGDKVPVFNGRRDRENFKRAAAAEGVTYEYGIDKVRPGVKKLFG